MDQMQQHSVNTLVMIMSYIQISIYLFHTFTPTSCRYCHVCVCVCVCVLVAQSCPILCDPMDVQPTRLLCPWNFPCKDTGVGCHTPLQKIFPIQGTKPGLLHWQVDSLSSQPSQERVKTEIQNKRLEGSISSFVHKQQNNFRVQIYVRKDSKVFSTIRGKFNLIFSNQKIK